MANDVMSNQVLSSLAANFKNVILTVMGEHCTIHLTTDSFAPGPNFDPSGLTAPLFGGYAPKNCDTFGDIRLLSNGNYAFNSAAVLQWNPTDSTASPPVQGWWAVAPSGDVVSMGLFNPPVPLTNATQVLTLVPTFGVGPASVQSVQIP